MKFAVIYRNPLDKKSVKTQQVRMSLHRGMGSGQNSRQFRIWGFPLFREYFYAFITATDTLRGVFKPREPPMDRGYGYGSRLVGAIARSYGERGFDPLRLCRDPDQVLHS